MDAFAENQMGREPKTPTISARNSGRNSRTETLEAGAVLEAAAQKKTTEAEVGLLDSTDGDAPVDIPGLSVEESALIAARWDRKKSAFMPVGDPYAEPDTTTPYTKRLLRHYCTGRQLLLGAAPPGGPYLSHPQLAAQD